MTKLLAIFSLQKSQRIRCQHPNCKKTVYAKIHLIEHENQVFPVGSTCFKTYFGEKVTKRAYAQAPVLNTLSESEKSQILNNTAQFLKDHCSISPIEVDDEQYEKQLKEECQNYTRIDMLNMGMNPEEPAFQSTFIFRWKSLYNVKLKKGI